MILGGVKYEQYICPSKAVSYFYFQDCEWNAICAFERAVLSALCMHCARLALESGGTDNGAPGFRAHYAPDGVGCFVIDLDDNNIEVVYRP